MSLTSRARAARDLIALTVLALLTERPCHPYEMQRLMRERHKDFAIGKARSFYDAVNRLVQDGLVEPLETNREGRRPERTIYRITDEGREEFHAWLRDLLATPIIEYPIFTVAVNFLAYLPPERALQALQARIVALESRLAGLEVAIRAVPEQLRLPRIVLLEHEHTRALLQAELAWVRSISGEIQTGRLTWSVDLDWVQQHLGGECEPRDVTLTPAHPGEALPHTDEKGTSLP